VQATAFWNYLWTFFQTAAVKPVIEAARRNRKGTIFATASPDIPGPRRLQAVALGQKARERIRTIIAEEVKLAK